MRQRIIWMMTVLLLACTVNTEAKGIKGIMKSLWEWFISPNPRVDTTYIYQSTQLWTARLQTDIRKSNVKMDTRGETETSFFDEMDNNIVMDNEYIWNTRMNTPVVMEAGAFISLRSLSIGYMREINHHSGQSSKSNYFNLMDAGYGLNIRYNSIYSPLVSTFKNYTDKEPVDLSTEEKARMRSIAIDGYYAFNQKRFAYDAAYDGAYVQQRSAGSFLATAKYTFGELNLPDKDVLFIPFNNGVSRYKTYQLAIGPGYSYNWVPYHHPARDDRRSGMRNLTVNVTFSPLLTVINNMTYFVSEYDEASDSYREKDSHHMKGGLKMNLIARGAISYTFGNWAIYGSIDYHHVKMKDSNVNTYDIEGFYGKDEYTTRTNISNLAASLMLSVKF